MNTVIVEPNQYTGAYLLQTIVFNMLQPNLNLDVVSTDTDDIVDNSCRHFVTPILEIEQEKIWLKHALMRTDNLSIIRTRLLDDIVHNGSRAFYITYNDNNLEILKQKRIVVDKLKEFDITKFLAEMVEEHYESLRGSSWPTWEEFKAGRVHPELLGRPDEMGEDRDPLGHWHYSEVTEHTDLCEITFDSILNGYEILEQVENFLGVKATSSQKSLIDNYREKFLELDY